MLIPKDTSVDDIERLYYEVDHSNSDSLEITNGYKSLRIGLIPRLAQFFITIAKQDDLSFNFCWAKLNDKTRLKNIIEDPISLTALLISDKIYGENKKPIKRELNGLLISRFDSTVFKKGKQIQMMAVDHSIEKYAKPECFYSQTEPSFTTRNSAYYFELLKSYFNESVKGANFEKNEFEAISELLTELIDNTEQHAKSDYTRGISKKSVRSVVLTSHLMLKGQKIEPFCGENNPTSEYIKSVKSTDDTLHLLEISIFDSGPGIYKSYPTTTKNNSSLNDEVSVLLNSFKNGVTSKPNGIGVGRGLDKARIIINDRNGFISIRTGRLSVYRNFKLSPLTYFENSTHSDVDFFDEKTRSSHAFSEMKNVEGLSYTILVPLR